LRLGFAGTPAFAVPALDALFRSGHTLEAVLTKQDRAAGRGRQVQVSPVKRRALELGIPVHQPASFKDPDALRALLGLDALVVVAYGLLLPPAALAAPRLGCFNIHASLLPRWRGAAPIQRAVLAGDEMTGISIMRMEAQLDTGPVLAARAIDIGPLETAGALQDRLAALGAELICEALEALAAGRATEVPQPAIGVTYAAKISKSEADIDWREDAVQVLRKVRAFNPSPVAQTLWDKVQLRIWEASLAPAGAAAPGGGAPGHAAAPETAMPGAVIRAAPEGIDVACGTGALRITRLQLPGRKAVTSAEFVRAERLAGARLGA
jgi:methionyl-tRNA formyltransferase